MISCTSCTRLHLCLFRHYRCTRLLDQARAFKHTRTHTNANANAHTYKHTLRMMSLCEVHLDSLPVSFTPMTLGHFSSQGRPEASCEHVCVRACRQESTETHQAHHNSQNKHKSQPPPSNISHLLDYWPDYLMVGNQASSPEDARRRMRVTA